MKDAHDRYANVETGYLLQKMEEHEGIVVLATNLDQNLDDAFKRRMHFVVEVPSVRRGGCRSGKACCLQRRQWPRRIWVSWPEAFRSQVEILRMCW